MKLLKVSFDSKENGKDLMVVTFEEDGKTFTWAPKWADVRRLFENAAATEFINTHGIVNEELTAFFSSAVFVHHLDLCSRGD
jgi:hypothetical protein